MITEKDIELSARHAETKDPRSIRSAQIIAEGLWERGIDARVTRRFPRPWRLGHKLQGAHYGFVTVYDATPEGDGGEGRLIGLMVEDAAREMVEKVNEV